ncbi:hypothetical protein ISCGN_015276, partial [Ixodes scapularis]
AVPYHSALPFDRCRGQRVALLHDFECPQQCPQICVRLSRRQVPAGRADQTHLVAATDARQSAWYRHVLVPHEVPLSQCIRCPRKSRSWNCYTADHRKIDQGTWNI